MKPHLSFTQKVSRFRARLREAEWRKYGMVLLTGKFVAIALLLLVAVLINPGQLGLRTFAADPTLKGNDIVNPINTVWTLVAAFLVFGMQVGFTMLEAGFCRSRERVIQCSHGVHRRHLPVRHSCSTLFGFAFMFSHGNGFIGKNWFMLDGAPATYETTGVAFLAFWLFQFAFADTCSTITSGAMIGRTAFAGDLIYSVGVSGFIYPIIGHWAWGPDGFLANMGSANNFLPWVGTSFHDFAGSTVVHTIGGFIALAGAIVLGPRLGREVQTRRRWTDAPPRFDYRCLRRSAPLVRLVRLQCRQHAVGDGLRRDRARGRQYHASPPAPRVLTAMIAGYIC